MMGLLLNLLRFTFRAKPAALRALCLCFALCFSFAPCFAQTTTRTRIPQQQDPADAILASALAAMDRKDYDAAASGLQEYLAKKPGDATAHFQLGYTYTVLKRPADAKAEYEKAVALRPDFAEAQLNLGLTLLDSDPAAAVAPLEKAADLAPNQARLRFLLGLALERSGKAAAAIESYRAAEKLDDQNSEIPFALGRTFLNAGRANEAEPEFRKAIGSRPDADSSRAHLGLAQSLYAQKKTEAAAAEYAAYLEAHPDDNAARIEHASALEDLGKDDESLAELDRAALAAPENLRALKLRSLADFHKKQYDGAVSALLKAQALAPQDPDIPARLGHVYLEKKDYPNAIRALVVALKIDSSGDDVLKDLVTAQYLNKNYPAALQGLDLLAKRETLPAGSWFIRGTCYDKLGQPAQALDAYEKFLQLNKDENNDMYFEASARVRFLKRELENKKR
jgi:Flp pilus assembly protein TadD